MLPTYDQKKPTKTTPLNSKNFNPDYRKLNFTPCFVFFNLTICSLTTMYRAYEHSDFPVVAFIAFVYLAYFVLEKCLVLYNGLPRAEKSVKKEVLRFTLWGLSSGILFGFAYQFGTFMNLAVVMVIYFIVIASSLLLFYVYYILDDQNGIIPPQSACSNKQYSNSDNV